MAPAITIAAFDLGIKNLSYCVATFAPALTEISRWANLNLLADGADSQSQTRCSCGGPASYQDAGVLLCKKCAKKSSKPLFFIDGADNKHLSVPDIRTWIQGPPLSVPVGIAKKLKKTEMLEKIATVCVVPYTPPKIKSFSLQKILAGMEQCLTAELPYIAKASVIRIENQPSEFAPHMKSIQVMLFTLLDHRLRTEMGWTGVIEFANASVKTRGTEAETGKDKKPTRKLAAIAKVKSVLAAVPFQGVAEQYTWWQTQVKQDDLADAFLMCLDASNKS